MAEPFISMFRSILDSPVGIDIFYNASPTAIRAVPRQPDTAFNVGERQVRQDSRIFEVSAGDVSDPAGNFDFFTWEGRTYRVQRADPLEEMNGWALTCWRDRQSEF